MTIAFQLLFSGWVAVAPDDDWHFYWASTTTCRNLFAVDSGKLQLKFLLKAIFYSELGPLGVFLTYNNLTNYI